MTGCFDPALLIRTGIRAAVSTVFGRYADRRETIAAANVIAPVPPDAKPDYSEHQGDFWFDYLADTGDGWNPTYAMARLLSEDALPDPLGALPRGRLLVLGGDQVHPSASRTEYARRFRAPFEEAYRPGGMPRWREGGENAPHLYALPGDHDWHDGLNALFGLFCRRRCTLPGALGSARDGATIAGRETRQTRSYFAPKLPRGCGLCGNDSLMERYIDQPQIDYFSHVATSWMEPGSKLILCVAEPVWEDAVSGRIDDRYRASIISSGSPASPGTRKPTSRADALRYAGSPRSRQRSACWRPAEGAHCKAEGPGHHRQTCAPAGAALRKTEGLHAAPAASDSDISI